MVLLINDFLIFKLKFKQWNNYILKFKRINIPSRYDKLTKIKKKEIYSKSIRDEIFVSDNFTKNIRNPLKKNIAAYMIEKKPFSK